MEANTQGQEMTVTIYSTPNCVKCMMTKRLMDKYGIEYVEEDLTQHLDLLEKFKAEGHQTAPIVTTDIKTWSDFRIDKIKSLANYLMGEKVHGDK